MELPGTVRQWMERHGLPLELLPHTPTRTLSGAARAAGVPLDRVVRGVLLEESGGVLLAVLPFNRLIDFDAIHQRTGHRLTPAKPSLAQKLFPDCEAASIPPLPEPYGLVGLLDTAIPHDGDLYIEPGSHGLLLRLPAAAFLKAHEHTRQVSFSRPVAQLVSHNPNEFLVPGLLEDHHATARLRPPEDLRQRLSDLQGLPVLPETANSIIRLAAGRPTIAELVALVESDPSLAAQVVRVARSPVYNYPGRVETVHDAINRVLGFDVVMGMAIGLSAGRSLADYSEGPLGHDAFWRQAVYSALLTQALADTLPRRMGVRSGPAYLAGLLHNIGYLAMAQLFKPELYLLNRAVALNPEVPIPLVEKRLLGLSHAEIGGWLLAGWEMPEAVVVSAREHHNETYSGGQAIYANLVLVADHALKRYGIGDAAGLEPPAQLLTGLGLSGEQVRSAAARIMASREGIEGMVQEFAA